MFQISLHLHMDRKSFEFVCATSVEPFPSPFNGSFRPLTSNCLLDLSWITDIYSIASCPIPKPACKDVICNTHGKPPDTPSQLEVFMIIYAPWISMDLYGSLAFHYSPVTLILPRTSATVAGCGLRIKCRQKLWGWCQFVQERRYSRLFAVAWSHLHSCSSHDCTWYRPAMWNDLERSSCWVLMAWLGWSLGKGVAWSLWLAASTIKSDSLIIFGTPVCSKQTRWHNPKL